ncbi:MAG: PqqD family protein [Bacteroidales bacterium]|nr:PqqD family protein [Bacteroidales bacterium]
MKKTKEFIKRNIAGEIVLVPSGQTAQDFNGMISLTETGEFIWEHIEETRDFHHLIQLILDEYEVDRDTASQDASIFIMQLLEAGMIRPTGINW